MWRRLLLEIVMPPILLLLAEFVARMKFFGRPWHCRAFDYNGHSSAKWRLRRFRRVSPAAAGPSRRREASSANGVAPSSHVRAAANGIAYFGFCSGVVFFVTNEQTQMAVAAI